MTNKKGAAIQYSGEIPRAVASASGELFEKILEIARKNDITIYHDSELAENLSQLQPGTDIPEDLFKAMAIVFSHCFFAGSRFKEKLSKMDM